MVSWHPRAWSLGALVARDLKGVERPVRLYRLRPEAAG